jgi:hypothetical protein
MEEKVLANGYLFSDYVYGNIQLLDNDQLEDAQNFTLNENAALFVYCYEIDNNSKYAYYYDQADELRYAILRTDVKRMAGKEWPYDPEYTEY